MLPIVNDQVVWFVSQFVCLSPSEPAENLEAIEIPFAFRIWVGPGKDLLHIADHFGRILYFVHSTQYSTLVLACDLYFVLITDMHCVLLHDISRYAVVFMMTTMTVI